jgi:hypothetical protein
LCVATAVKVQTSSVILFLLTYITIVFMVVCMPVRGSSTATRGGERRHSRAPRPPATSKTMPAPRSRAGRSGGQGCNTGRGWPDSARRTPDLARRRPDLAWPAAELQRQGLEVGGREAGEEVRGEEAS